MKIFQEPEMQLTVADKCTVAKKSSKSVPFARRGEREKEREGDW